jgi:hypothetical protein
LRFDLQARWTLIEMLGAAVEQVVGELDVAQRERHETNEMLRVVMRQLVELRRSAGLTGLHEITHHTRNGRSAAHHLRLRVEQDLVRVEAQPSLAIEWAGNSVAVELTCGNARQVRVDRSPATVRGHQRNRTVAAELPHLVGKYAEIGANCG